MKKGKACDVVFEYEDFFGFVYLVGSGLSLCDEFAVNLSQGYFYSETDVVPGGSFLLKRFSVKRNTSCRTDLTKLGL